MKSNEILQVSRNRAESRAAVLQSLSKTFTIDKNKAQPSTSSTFQKNHQRAESQNQKQKNIMNNGLPDNKILSFETSDSLSPRAIDMQSSLASSIDIISNFVSSNNRLREGISECMSSSRAIAIDNTSAQITAQRRALVRQQRQTRVIAKLRSTRELRRSRVVRSAIPCTSPSLRTLSILRDSWRTYIHRLGASGLFNLQLQGKLTEAELMGSSVVIIDHPQYKGMQGTVIWTSNLYLSIVLEKAFCNFSLGSLVKLIKHECIFAIELSFLKDALDKDIFERTRHYSADGDASISLDCSNNYLIIES